EASRRFAATLACPPPQSAMPFQLSALRSTAAIEIRRICFQQVFPVPLHARIAQLGKILQGIAHLPFLTIPAFLHIASYGH
ncbi:MAG: hypothetical protein ACYCSN_19735, partial [Acidobacteriaceae bacterium]